MLTEARDRPTALAFDRLELDAWADQYNSRNGRPGRSQGERPWDAKAAIRFVRENQHNTGCRDAEICRMQWDWEVKVPPLETFVFIVPGSFVKNGDERLVVLNDIARSIVNARRGKHPTHVFVYKGKPVQRMLNSAWCRVRKEVSLPQVRVQDLKHTFGRRLRAAGVSFEDRQDLLGHRSGRMTTHYSAAELSKLIEAANSVCERNGNKPELVVLRRLSVS